MSYSKYPTSLDDAVSLPLAIDTVTPVSAIVINRLRDAVLAVQAELGTDPSRTYGTVRDRLDALRGAIETNASAISALELRVAALEAGGGGGGGPHATTHEDGGSDEVTAQNLGSGSAPVDKVMVTDGGGGWTLEDYAAFVAHGATHVDGGSDELTVQDLGSGTAPDGYVLLADGLGGWNIDELIAQDLSSDGADDGYIMVADGLGGWTVEPIATGAKIVPGVSGYEDTQDDSWQEIGGLVFNPAEYSGATAFEFEALIQTTIIAKSVSIRLYNLTDGAAVASSVQTSTSLVPELKSVSLSIPADLPNSEKIYTVQIKMSIAGGPNERGICKAAYIKVS